MGINRVSGDVKAGTVMRGAPGAPFSSRCGVGVLNCAHSPSIARDVVIPLVLHGRGASSEGAHTAPCSYVPISHDARYFTCSFVS
jgi:hypothetical protein